MHELSATKSKVHWCSNTCLVEGVEVHVVEVLPARPVDAGVGEEGHSGKHC